MGRVRSIGRGLNVTFWRVRGARTRTIQALAMLLVLLMVATQFAGFLFTVRQHEAWIDLRNDTRDMRITQQALVDAEDAVANFVLAPEGGHLDRYFTARELLESNRGTVRRLDRIASPDQVRDGKRPAEAAVGRLERLWDRAIGLVKADRREEAGRVLQEGVNRHLINVRGDVTRYLAIRNAEGAELEERRELGNKVVTTLQLLGGALILGVLALSFRMSAAQGRRRREAALDAVAAREQIEKLFRMTDMLQSAAGYEDANAVLHATVEGLMPDLAGAMFIFNNSRDRLDLSTSWNLPETHTPPDHIAPSACWALKRGKAHVNGGAGGNLRCEHQRFDGVVLELPMSARGEFYGLLCFAAQGPDAQERIAAGERHGDGPGRLHVARPVQHRASRKVAQSSAARLADRSLQSPIHGGHAATLRASVRAQPAPFFRHHDRPRSLQAAERRTWPRGWRRGAARCRATPSSASLRQSDVACRYGGEEIIVLLPDVDLADAAGKAETLRQSIENISERHGSSHASLGVASVPDNACHCGGHVGLADEALYQAKKFGPKSGL
jgi:hypothetical protein